MTRRNGFNATSALDPALALFFRVGNIRAARRRQMSAAMRAASAVRSVTSAGTFMRSTRSTVGTQLANAAMPASGHTTRSGAVAKNNRLRAASFVDASPARARGTAASATARWYRPLCPYTATLGASALQDLRQLQLDLTEAARPLLEGGRELIALEHRRTDERLLLLPRRLAVRL